MPERLRSVVVTVSVDTNRATTTETYELGEDETVDELLRRVSESVHDIVSAIA